MPLLLIALGWLAKKLIGLLIKFCSNRVAAVVCILTLTVVVWGGTYAALKSLWAGLGLVMPATLAHAALMVKPSHFDAYVAAYVTGNALIAAYKWNKRTVQSMAAAATSSQVC